MKFIRLSGLADFLSLVKLIVVKIVLRTRSVFLCVEMNELEVYLYDIELCWKEV
jgi:hypothetical protein